MNTYFDLKMILSVAAGIILAGVVAHVIGFLALVSMGGGYGHMGGGRMMERKWSNDARYTPNEYSDTDSYTYDDVAPVDGSEEVPAQE